MVRNIVLAMGLFLAGCRLFDVPPPKTGPWIMLEPAPSKIVVTFPAAVPGDAEVQDVVLRVFGTGTVADRTVTITDYALDYWDMDGKPLPSLDIEKRPLSAPLNVDAAAGHTAAQVFKLEILRPAVVDHGRSMLQNSSTKMVHVAVTLFGTDGNGRGLELGASVPIQFIDEGSTDTSARR